MPTESRTHVAQALHAVFGQGSRIPDSWDADLGQEDAKFAQALLGLCLRRWGRLQTFILSKLADPDRGLPLGTQVSLAIGLAQLAWLPGVSDHAAVNEAVELASGRSHGFPPHKGLVNALLRAGARDREGLKHALEGLPAALDRTPFTERLLLEALAPRHQEARLEELWERLQTPARPCFRALKNEPLPEGLEPDPDLPQGLRLAPGGPFPRRWLTEGAGMVQDRSSQALMDFHWDRPVQRIADLCASPGGKTTSLALRWPDAELFAVEQHPRRARRLEENLQARGIRAHLIVQEAAAWLRSTDLTFDLILLDAPCSGTGTFRKHPELLWLGDSLEMGKLLDAQRSLLNASIAKLNSQGLLIYSVCSWLREECLLHRGAILGEQNDLKGEPIWPCRFSCGIDQGSQFLPDPLEWEGEGFQAFALGKP
jgi:16S rRNA (cytosine967-C5)-methyltransferase